MQVSEPIGRLPTPTPTTFKAEEYSVRPKRGQLQACVIWLIPWVSKALFFPHCSMGSSLPVQISYRREEVSSALLPQGLSFAHPIRRTAVQRLGRCCTKHKMGSHEVKQHAQASGASLFWRLIAIICLTMTSKGADCRNTRPRIWEFSSKVKQTTWWTPQKVNSLMNCKPLHHISRWDPWLCLITKPMQICKELSLQPRECCHNNHHNSDFTLGCQKWLVEWSHCPFTQKEPLWVKHILLGVFRKVSFLCSHLENKRDQNPATRFLKFFTGLASWLKKRKRKNSYTSVPSGTTRVKHLGTSKKETSATLR